MIAKMAMPLRFDAPPTELFNAVSFFSLAKMRPIPLILAHPNRSVLAGA